MAIDFRSVPVLRTINTGNPFSDHFREQVGTVFLSGGLTALACLAANNFKPDDTTFAGAGMLTMAFTAVAGYAASKLPKLKQFVHPVCDITQERQAINAWRFGAASAALLALSASVAMTPTHGTKTLPPVMARETPALPLPANAPAHLPQLAGPR